MGRPRRRARDVRTDHRRVADAQRTASDREQQRMTYPTSPPAGGSSIAALATAHRSHTAASDRRRRANFRWIMCYDPDRLARPCTGFRVVTSTGWRGKIKTTTTNCSPLSMMVGTSSFTSHTKRSENESIVSASSVSSGAQTTTTPSDATNGPQTAPSASCSPYNRHPHHHRHPHHPGAAPALAPHDGRPRHPQASANKATGTAAPQKLENAIRRHAAVDISPPEVKMALPDAKLAADGAVS